MQTKEEKVEKEELRYLQEPSPTMGVKKNYFHHDGSTTPFLALGNPYIATTKKALPKIGISNSVYSLPKKSALFQRCQRYT